MVSKAPRLLTIPPGRPFLRTLTEALLDGRLTDGFRYDPADPLSLAGVTLLVGLGPVTLTPEVLRKTIAQAILITLGIAQRSIMGLLTGREPLLQCQASILLGLLRGGGGLRQLIKRFGV